MKLTHRQKLIIKSILESDDSITCQNIAKKINVSDRTVLNEVNYINSKLNKKNRMVIEKGKGIKISKKETIFELHNLYTSIMEEEELVLEFINIILMNNYFGQKVYSEEIAEDLYISLSSLKRVIKKARLKLKEYQIDIVVSNIKGIYLRGKEKNIRLCMSNIIFSSKNEYENFLIKINFFTRSEIDRIKNIVLNILDDFEMSLTYIAFNSFIIHILISIIRSNNRIDYEKYIVDELNKSKEKYVVLKIITEIKDKLDYKLDEDSYYLTQHLISSQKYSYRVDGKTQSNNEELTVDLILKNIIRRINKNFSMDLSYDEIFTQSLKIHLLTSINRYKINSPIKHIDLSEIKSQYPIAYDMGIIAGDEISKVLNITLDDTEILFLALHMGAAFSRYNKQISENKCSILIVCGAGLSTAKFLKYSLLENFEEEISNIELISYYEYKDEMKNEYDIILSGLNNGYEIEGSIKVNYVLTDLELKILKNKLLNVNNKDLLNPFQDELFYVKSFDKKEDVLSFMTNDLLDKDLLNIEDKKSIYKREKMGNTSLGNMIAIPHPLSYSSKEMRISVLINSNVINWGEDDVRLVMLLMIPKNKIKDWDILFKKLYKVFNKKNAVERLCKSLRLEEFKSILIEEME